MKPHVKRSEFGYRNPSGNPPWAFTAPVTNPSAAPVKRSAMQASCVPLEPSPTRGSLVFEELPEATSMGYEDPERTSLAGRATRSRDVRGKRQR